MHESQQSNAERKAELNQQIATLEAQKVSMKAAWDKMDDHSSLIPDLLILDEELDRLKAELKKL